MRLILFVVLCCNLAAGITGDSNNVNMKVLMSCPSQPSSCRNVESTRDREIITLASGMKVMCDTQTDGGGWIIIQRRINGEISFYRGWEEYRYGFGNYSFGEFYLGNENIYQLTSKSQHELRIDMKFNNKSYYASYSHFRIMGEQYNYKLKISGYSGNAGDNLLNPHDNKSFSTYDMDNDNSPDNCGAIRKGAWWYDNCHYSQLNGVWGSTNFAEGVIWHSLTGDYASASFTEMKIREIEL